MITLRDLLLSMGCREWRRASHHRIYLPTAVAASVLGLEVGYYESGNISSARLAGEPISNSQARAMLQALDGVYYDVIKDRFVGSYTATIGSHLRARAAEGQT